MALRPTARGWGLTVAGLVATVSAVLLGSVDLLRGGVLLLVVAGVSAVAATIEHGSAHRNLEVHRTIDPQPMSVGDPARITVVLTPAAGRRAPLGALQLRERAAVELSGGHALRAAVSRAPRQLSLSYEVHAARRGRWPIGPVTATVGDPFGMFTRSQTLGETVDVAVWPHVVELDVPHGGMSSDPETAALGSRTPSADDASLRIYRPGDDLRRVHWASSAKRGTMLVRNDERSGRRPVTVLLDLPSDEAGTEWSISLAASIALAMLRAGHPVRFVAAGGTVRDGGSAAALAHSRPPWNETGVATVLDATIDLTPPASTEIADTRLLAAAEILATHDPAETVIAVLGATSTQAQTALASAVGGGHGWAIIRVSGSQDVRARQTQTALTHAGWWTSTAEPGDDLASTWDALAGERP